MIVGRVLRFLNFNFGVFFGLCLLKKRKNIEKLFISIVDVKVRGKNYELFFFFCFNFCKNDLV